MTTRPSRAEPVLHSDRWARLCVQLGATAPLPSLEFIAAAYNDPPRAYHNAGHILDCLEQFDAYIRAEATLPEWRSFPRQGSVVEVEAALWFHDVVYDPRAKDNEEQSVRFMERMLFEAQVSQAVIERIAERIMATKHQTPPQSPADALIIDIDLSILGRIPEPFEAYDKAIREEYAWVPWKEYRHGRVQVLKHFLDRKPIYCIPFFQKRYESQARVNLEKKIRELMP